MQFAGLGNWQIAILSVAVHAYILLHSLTYVVMTKANIKFTVVNLTVGQRNEGVSYLS